jgi:rubrerythrin
MPKQTEECVDTFTKGLDAAFKDDQETIDFSLRAAEEPQIQRQRVSLRAPHGMNKITMFGFYTI